METCQVSHLSKPKALCLSTILGAVQTSVTREQNGTWAVQTGTFWSISTLNFFRVCTVGNFCAPSLTVLTFVSCEMHKNSTDLRSIAASISSPNLFMILSILTSTHVRYESFLCSVNASNKVHNSAFLLGLSLSVHLQYWQYQNCSPNIYWVAFSVLIFPDTANRVIPGEL